MASAASSLIAANALCSLGDAAQKPRRFVAVSQKRVTSDLPYNGWPVGWIKPSTKAEYILIGSTAPADRPVLTGENLDALSDEIGVLRGQIIVIMHHDDPSAKKAADRVIDAVRRLIAEYAEQAPRGSVCEIAELPDRAHALLSAAVGKGVKPLQAEFELYRTGELRMTIDPSQVASISEQDGKSDASRFAELVARQMYYFLKDSAHRHYHHRSSSDNLLPLIPANDQDDTSWRRDTLWALVRSILEARRRSNLTGYKSALGILAYADAFQSLLAKIQRGDRNGPPFARWHNATLYDFSHTRASLEATIGEREFAETSGATFKSVVVTTLLASAALWLGTLQVEGSLCGKSIAQSHCATPPGWMSGVLRHLIENPSDGFGVLFAGGLFWYGDRLRVLPATKWLLETLDGWGQAIGATLARSWRKRLLGYSDLIGTVAAAFFLLTAGALFIALIGEIFRLW